jgi:hypothetical protein
MIAGNRPFGHAVFTGRLRIFFKASVAGGAIRSALRRQDAANP